MTTTVKVMAHCEKSKEVKISFENDHGLNDVTIQDGEEYEFVVYDDKTGTVKEIDKISV